MSMYILSQVYQYMVQLLNESLSSNFHADMTSIKLYLYRLGFHKLFLFNKSPLFVIKLSFLIRQWLALQQTAKQSLLS